MNLSPSASGDAKPHVLILSFSHVDARPRELRQALFFHTNGYTVSIAGFCTCTQNLPPYVTFIPLTPPLQTFSAKDESPVPSLSRLSRSPSWPTRLLRALMRFRHSHDHDHDHTNDHDRDRVAPQSGIGKSGRNVLRWGLEVTKGAVHFLSFIPGVAHLCYWKLKPFYKHTFQLLSHAYPSYPHPHPHPHSHSHSSPNPPPFSLIIAHDIFCIPMAWRLGRLWNIPYTVDLHEHPRTQHQSSCFWKNVSWFFRDWFYTHALLKRYLPYAHVVTTVSSGIADDLRSTYALEKIYPVRNTPSYSPSPYADVVASPSKMSEMSQTPPLKLLFHGNLDSRRGIERLIEMMAFTLPHVHLTLRGNACPSYLESIQRSIALCPQITLSPPVPRSVLIHETAMFHVGVYWLNPYSKQLAWSLPNKFFEYVMAGLMLAVTDETEMALLIKRYDLGFCVPHAFTPRQLASYFNELSPLQCALFRKNALRAAQELCWEKEQHALARSYAFFVPPRRGAGPPLGRGGAAAVV